MDENVQFLQECFPFAEFEILEFLSQENSLENCFKILLKEEEEQIGEPLLIIPKQTKKDLVYKLETESNLKSLKEMFSNFHETAIENVYADCDGDYERTAGMLSEHLTRNSTDVAIRDRNATNELRMIFPPEVLSDRDLIAAFYESGFDLELCIDKLLKAANPLSGNPVWQKLDVPSAFANPPKSIINFHVAKHTQADDTPQFPQTSSPSNLTPTELRNLVALIARERGQLFDQARTYFKQGSLTGRSAASFYAEKARELTLKINQLNNLASQSQIKLNATNQSNDQLDLHGLTVNEAIDYIKTWSQGKSRVDGWFKIITGAGNNSEGRKAKLLPAVTNYIKKIGWKIDESKSGPGWIVVKSVK